MSDMIYMTMPITKSTEDADGRVFVEGIATNDSLDLDEQVINKEFAKAGLTKWFTDWANVRQMHSGNLAPAGKAVEMRDTPEGIWVRTEVIEPVAKALVKSGVYQAYSVGVGLPRIRPHAIAKNGEIFDGIFSEISLVDFPANPTCKFMMAKRANIGEIETVNADVTKDGSITDTKVAVVDADAEKAKPNPFAKKPDADAKADADDGAADNDGDNGGDGKPPADGKAPPFAKKDDGTETVAYHYKRLHDALCPCYTANDVLSVHPAVVKGVPEVVGLAAFSEAVTEALSPENMHSLKSRSDAYQLAVEVSMADPDLVDAGVESVRKAFAEFYPNAHPTVTDMAPGKFARGFLSDGRASMTPGAAPRMPMTPKVPSPDSINRGELTDGRARSSAQKSFGDAEKSSAVEAITALHNYIAQQTPELCALEQPGGTQNVPITAPVVAKLDNKADVGPIGSGPIESVNKIIGGSETANTTSALKAADIEALITKSVEPMAVLVAELTKRIAGLESGPDPATVAARNGTAYSAFRRPAEASENEADKDATIALVRLVKAAKHPDSTISGPAIDKLLRQVSPADFATLLD
jgi:hypothetical protein